MKITVKKIIGWVTLNGKSKADIVKEYDAHILVIGRRLSQYENRSELELENIQLKKKIQIFWNRQ